MKTLAAVMLMTTMLAGVALAQTFDFHKLQVGEPPAGWNCTKTGVGDAKWTIARDDYPPNFWNVLKQSGSGATASNDYPTPSVFPICILNGPTIMDGSVQANIKMISGKQYQGAGLIWRVKDSNNYNIARANALENDVTIYQTVNGKRTMKVRRWFPVTQNVWHNLRVDFKGNAHTVTYDGQLVAIWIDETFMEQGKVGVWTKADSVVFFDDFTYGTQ